MGGGYVNSCIRSGTIATSGDLPTTWYNYALASAGTITNTDMNEWQGNSQKATESVCPKGWTLPIVAQINTNRDVSGFSPVLGGYYYGGIYANENTRGFWWNSEVVNGADRYVLGYDTANLYGSANRRYCGFYIRCVPAP